MGSAAMAASHGSRCATTVPAWVSIGHRRTPTHQRLGCRALSEPGRLPAASSHWSTSFEDQAGLLAPAIAPKRHMRHCAACPGVTGATRPRLALGVDAFCCPCARMCCEREASSLGMGRASVGAGASYESPLLLQRGAADCPCSPPVHGGRVPRVPEHGGIFYELRVRGGRAGSFGHQGSSCRAARSSRSGATHT